MLTAIGRKALIAAADVVGWLVITALYWKPPRR